MIMLFSIFFDVPQVALRDRLYKDQLEALSDMARVLEQSVPETPFQDDLAFRAMLNVTIRDKNSKKASNHMPIASGSKVRGTEVYNISKILNLSYPLIRYRRKSELVYTRIDGGLSCVNEEGELAGPSAAAA